MQCRGRHLACAVGEVELVLCLLVARVLVVAQRDTSTAAATVRACMRARMCVRAALLPAICASASSCSRFSAASFSASAWHTDMSVRKLMGHVCGHVYRHAHGHAHGVVHRHASRLPKHMSINTCMHISAAGTGLGTAGVNTTFTVITTSAQAGMHGVCVDRSNRRYRSAAGATR